MGSCQIIIHYADDDTFTAALPTDAVVELWHYQSKAEAHALWDKLIALEITERAHLPPAQVTDTLPRRFTLVATPGALATKISGR